jgi:hypothetical protein
MKSKQVIYDKKGNRNSQEKVPDVIIGKLTILEFQTKKRNG